MRHLLARAPQHLLADELGEPHLEREVALLVGRVEEGALRQQLDQAGDELVRRRRPVSALTGNISPGTPRSAAAWSAATVRGLSSRSTLLSAVTQGTPAFRIACAMKRSPGPISCSPFRTNSTASASGQRALDAPLHALGERVARALDAGQVDEHELPVVAGRDAADLAPRRLRLVGDDRHLAADDPVDERRLAGVRPAGSATKPERVTAAP